MKTRMAKSDLNYKLSILNYVLLFLATTHVDSFHLVSSSSKKVTSIPSFPARNQQKHIDIQNYETFKSTFSCKAVENEQIYTSSSSVLKSTSRGGDSNTQDSKQNENAIQRHQNRRELIAEFLGTFLIVQIGCGTVCSAIFHSAQIGLWQIAVVWSIAVTLAISTTASISGAHLNPAITISFALVRNFPWKKVLPYIGAQLVGSIAAAFTNYFLFYESIHSFELSNKIIRGSIESVKSASAFGEYWSISSTIRAFCVEAYGTAILSFVIFALTNPRNKVITKDENKTGDIVVPSLIGMTVGALISVLAPLTQAGFNPARDFGPRVVALLFGWKRIAMKGCWLYIFAPLIGAPLGALVADRILYSVSDDDE